MKLSNLQIPPPTNWQDFESLCWDLWKEIWKDPNTKKHGRLGQEQQGVDVYGKPNNGRKWAGVQCKGKDNFADKKVTEKELKAEVTKAKKFKPKLSQFILATTGPKDTKIEKVARELTDAHRAKKLFSVDVWAWEDIVQELSHHPAVVRVHFQGLLENFETLEELKETSQAILESQSEIKKSQSEINESIASLSKSVETFSAHQLASINLGPQLQEAVLAGEYQAELDQVKDLVNSHQYKQALRLAENIKDRIWHNAPPVVRYRLLTNIGAAKLKLNQEEEAAKLFIQALQYNPEDEQALGNVALGHFLLQQYDQTKETCGRLLEKNPLSTRAYLLLVLISGPDEELNDIINRVPESLRSSPEIAYAIGQKAHNKGNIIEASEWTERALNHDKEASPEIKAVHGGMIIESVMRNESAMLQGQVRQTHKEDLEKAKNLITDAWDSVSDTDLRELRPNWILNRGLAKKLLGDTEGAILDTEIALSIEPNNPLFIKNRALLARIIGTKEENERAINLLTKIVSSDQTPEAALILAESLLDENRALEAKGVIERFLTNDAPIELIMGARRLQVQIYIELGHFDWARELAQALIRDDSSNILSFVVASQVESTNQKKDAALALLDEAHKLVGETTRPADLLNLANEFYVLGEFEKAARLYERITNTEVDSYLTRRLLSCYYNWGKLDVALDICTRLRSKYGPLRFVSEIESVIHEETNDLPKAKEVCREYLSSYPDDFLMKLRLAVVYLRSKSYQEVDEFLNAEIAFDSLTVDTGLQLGQLYAARDQDLK